MQKLTLWFLAQSLDGKRQRKPFICSDCGEKFLGRIALEEHSCSSVHKEKKPEKCTVVEKPLHKCGKCEKTFEILSDLESHGCQKNPFYDDSKDTKGKVNPYTY